VAEPELEDIAPPSPTSGSGHDRDQEDRSLEREAAAVIAALREARRRQEIRRHGGNGYGRT
jgi:hypothetical protein